MIQQDDLMNLSRYQSFLESEPHLQRVYQARQEAEKADEDADSDEDDNPADEAEGSDSSSSRLVPSSLTTTPSISSTICVR